MVPDKSSFHEMFLRGIRGEADRNGDRYVTGLELGEFLGEMVVNYSKKPSRILDGLRQIAIAFGYIDINPVRASLVAHPWEWRYGAVGTITTARRRCSFVNGFAGTVIVSFYAITISSLFPRALATRSRVLMVGFPLAGFSRR